jgi:hypothetical protein
VDSPLPERGTYSLSHDEPELVRPGTLRATGEAGVKFSASNATAINEVPYRNGRRSATDEGRAAHLPFGIILARKL